MTHYADTTKCHLCEGARSYPASTTTTLFPAQKLAGIETEKRYNTPDAFKGIIARNPKDQQTIDKAQTLRTDIQNLRAMADNDGKIKSIIDEKEKQLEALQEPTAIPEEHDLAGIQTRRAELLDKLNTGKTSFKAKYNNTTTT